jgi:stress response protein YsnF/sporulation protein YlmC with PRC-barrel domain
VNTSKSQQNKVKIEELFYKLRSKLSSFEVINLEGQKIGRIKDFTLDKNRRLYMVVPKSPSQTDSPVFLLSSKYVQNVDPSNRVVFVDISRVELSNLPLYQSSNNSEFYKQSSRALNQESSLKMEKADTEEQERSFVEKNLPVEDSKDLSTTSNSKADTEEIVRLLEERLIINRSRHKIGEIVVRRQIETRIVEVPIKREKLVVEKIDSENQQPIAIEQVHPEYFPNNGESAHSENLLVPESEISLTSQSRQNLEPETADSEIVEEEIVRLLEERLVVNRRKWKVGEVIVRKEIETEIVKVPIRREKLIVEQVGTETKIIAEIDLAAGEITENQQASSPKLASNQNTVVGEFLSPKAASNLLEAIALQKHHGCAKVRIEVVVENSELQETYQKMFDRCSTR